MSEQVPVQNCMCAKSQIVGNGICANCGKRLLDSSDMNRLVDLMKALKEARKAGRKP
jgi:hypothetical protein